VLSGILFGLMPAVHISKTNLNEVLKEGGRSGGGMRPRRWAGALVVTQVTLTLVLACVGPSGRATRLDPASPLRYD